MERRNKMSPVTVGQLRSNWPAPPSDNKANTLLRKLNQMIIYDPSVLNLTQGASVVTDALTAAATALTSSRPYFFRFFINPSSLNFSIKKIAKSVLTKKGWEILHFPGTPNEMLPMKFSGTTGSIVPPEALWNQGIRDTRLSMNYQRFQQLQNLALSSENDLKLYYDGKLYEGAFSDFNFSEDAEKPFSIQYSFTFTAYPDRTKNLATPDAITSLPVANTFFQAGVPV
jgi:hypothetical protein